jgi:hypothetical protein
MLEKEFDIMGNMYEAPFLQMLEDKFNSLETNFKEMRKEALDSNKCLAQKLDEVRSRLLIIETDNKHNVTFEDCGRRKGDLPDLIHKEAQPLIDSSIKTVQIKIGAAIGVLLIAIISFFIKFEFFPEKQKPPRSTPAAVSVIK